MNIRHLTLLITLCFLAISCATISPDVRRANADKTASAAGFEKELVRTGPFVLTAYSRIMAPGKPVVFYIEGDGYAFVTPTRVSGDPTPREPVVLQLAAQDPSPNVVYLARPCQYTPEAMNPACKEFYWTDGRFSEEVVSATAQAITFFSKKADASEIELVGYSGGAAVAVLVAARRTDVLRLRTIAGNLDPGLVNSNHGILPLEGSLDPLDAASKIASIPQLHFIGGDDDVIPFEVLGTFSARLGRSPCFHFKTLPDATHAKGWTEAWSALVRLPVSCSE